MLSLDLTRREFDLLAYLMRNSNRALTRATILEDVWGSDDAYSMNIVDVYIRYLRKKIERPAGQELIHTVRGYGYLLGQKD